jgi:hypothetical protein
MTPWRVTGGGLDATLTPFYDKQSAVEHKLEDSRTDQCFGTGVELSTRGSRSSSSTT